MTTNPPYSPIPELNSLRELEIGLDGEYLADGFMLLEFGDDSCLGGDAPPEMIAGLLPFAEATYSGSFYALWKCDDREELATLPVIFCGDEGELFIAARDLRELFQLLAVPDESDRVPPHPRFLAWLKDTLGLGPAEDPEALNRVALVEHGRAFTDWWLTFDDEDSIISQVLEELEELEET